MPHESQLIAEILANPQDDAPRLVCADWLEERGHPRGEFIRIQCELAGLPRSDPRRWGLLRRERELLQRYSGTWAGLLQDYVEEVTFRRGFVEHVRIRLDLFLKHAATLFQLAPLRSVSVAGDCRLLQDFAASAYVARLRRLDFDRNWIGYRGACLLASSPHLSGISYLGLNNNGIGIEATRQLCHSPHLGSLRTLILNRNTDVGDEGLKAIVGSPHFTRLRNLELLGCAIGDEGARTLSVSPLLGTLKRLNLKHNSITSAGFDSLFSSPYWSDDKVILLNRRQVNRLHLQFGPCFRADPCPLEQEAAHLGVQ